MTGLGSDVQSRVLQDLSLLVNVLSFSEQDSHHVKVSDLACPPYMIERPFTIISLAQIESKLILSASAIPQLVIVRLPLKQGVTEFGMSIVCGVMERSPASVISSINIGTICQQQLEGL